LNFGAIDRRLEQMVRAAGPDATILVISEPSTKEFSANAWLAEHGYLSWTSSPNPAPMDGKVLETADLNRQATLIDWTKTKAWCPPAGGNGIFIVRQDATHPSGASDDEYVKIRGQLKEELLSKDAVSRVWEQEELYAGPYQELAPDLMIEEIGVAVGTVLGRGPAFKSGTPFTTMPLSSITPILLYSLGRQMPGELEGCVPSEILEPAWVQSHPVLYASAGNNREAEKPIIDPKDEEEILRRLRGLGYLE
jgi:hypothetical protein